MTSVLGFIVVAYFGVAITYVAVRDLRAWLKRRAQRSAPSLTLGSQDQILRDLYSSAALEEMAKRENPLFGRLSKKTGTPINSTEEA